VLELTWQTVTEAYDEEFPRVETLFAALDVPSAVTPSATPDSD
jgi:hypothetical protein